MVETQQMNHCHECHEHAYITHGCNEEGEDYTTIDIDCPICGNQDTLHVWGFILEDELEQEINDYYEWLKK